MSNATVRPMADARASRAAEAPQCPYWVPSVADLMGLVKDGDRIGVSGFHFVRAPMAQLRALASRSPKNLWYVSWGGGLPLEVLLAAGCVAGVTFCFSSLDLFGLAPRFRAAMESGSLDSQELTALALIKGLEAAGQGLGVELLQLPAGSEVFPGDQDALACFTDVPGPPLAAVPAVNLDVLMLHAQRADADGNVEIAGARGLDVSQIFAARQVLVTVEEQVPSGELRDGGGYIVPRSFVNALALAPGGALPTSCLPYYGTDYSWLQQTTRLEPTSSWPALFQRPHRSPVPRLVARVARGEVQHTRVAAALRAQPNEPSGTSQPPGPAGYTVDELMTCILARQVSDSSICSIGSAAPLATAAYLLAKSTHAPRACILSHNGCYLDVAARPMCLWAAEALDYASCTAFTGGDATYHHFYQRGLVTHEVVSAGQVDRRGATNNVRIAKVDGGTVRLPGQGGMADVANLHVNFALYLTRHSPRSLVERVDFVSASRGWSPEERVRYGLPPGGVTVLTNLGQFRYMEQYSQLVLTHVHPGVTVDEVAAATGFSLVLAPEIAESSPPSVEELLALRRDVDPLGVRRLEFVPFRERAGLIQELLDKEERLLEAFNDQGGGEGDALFPGPPAVDATGRGAPR